MGTGLQAIRAHEFGGPEVLRNETVEDPLPGPGEVVIEVRAAGVNPADTYMRTGTYAVVPTLPYTPGGDAAGVISSVGEGVAAFKPGDRVFVGTGMGFKMTGCYAEKVTRPATDVLALPDGTGFAEGAALGVPYSTAHYALFARGGGVAAETVFVHGASGAVGIAAIQLAKRAGMTVIGSGGSDRGRALIEQQGADHVVDHTADGHAEEVLRLTGGQGPALILEMLANVNLATDLEIAARYGRIVIIGNRGEITVNPRRMMMRELDVRGIALWNCAPALITRIMHDLVAGLEEGSLKPVIGREMPLAEAAASHIAVLEPGAYGKIVLAPK